MLMTRDGGVARAAVRAGVDRVFLDLEIAGKAERQRGRNTIISGHTLADLERVRAAVPDAEVLARVNPPSAGTPGEVDAVVRAGAPAIRFGCGGGALLDAPHPVPPRDVPREHVRLGSRMIILSRTFTGDATSEAELAARVALPAEIAKIRQAVAAARARTADETERDRLRIRDLIWRVADQAVARAGSARWISSSGRPA